MIVKIIKKVIGIKSGKIMEISYRSKAWKQMKEWKQVEYRVQGLLYLKQNSKAFAIPILTAI